MKSDVQMQRDVLEELRWDTRVDVTDVGVAVDKGVVTLTGTVDDYTKRLAAQDAAHRVYGVLDVANDTEVKTTGNGNPTDTEIAQAVRQALALDVLVPEDHIHSTVSHGWVTLNGQVNSWTQREDAEYAIRHLSGVRGLVNLIAVSSPRVDPGTIREAIEGALERRADRDAARIKVEVNDSTVVLSGDVRSWMEKIAVLGTVRHAPGVQALEDRLHINPYA